MKTVKMMILAGVIGTLMSPAVWAGNMAQLTGGGPTAISNLTLTKCPTGYRLGMSTTSIADPCAETHMAVDITRLKISKMDQYKNGLTYRGLTVGQGSTADLFWINGEGATTDTMTYSEDVHRCLHMMKTGLASSLKVTLQYDKYPIVICSLE